MAYYMEMSQMLLAVIPPYDRRLCTCALVANLSVIPCNAYEWGFIKPYSLNLQQFVVMLWIFK